MGVLGNFCLTIMCFASVSQAFPPTAEMAGLINLVKIAVATQPKAPRPGQTGTIDPSGTPRDPVRTQADPTRTSKHTTSTASRTGSSTRNTGVDPTRTPTDPTRSSRRNTGVDPTRTPTDPTRSSRRNIGVDPTRTPTDPTRSSRRNNGVDPTRTPTDPTRSSNNGPTRTRLDPSRTRIDPTRRNIGRISSPVDQYRSSRDPQYTARNQYDPSQSRSTPRRNQDITELLAIATKDPNNQSNLVALVDRVLPQRSTLPPLIRPSRQPSRPGSGGRLLCPAFGDSCFSYDNRAINGPSCWYAIDEPRNRCCDEDGSFQSPINLPYFDQVEDMDSHLYYAMPHQEALSGRMENNGVYPKWLPEGRTAVLRGVRKNSRIGYILDSITLHFGATYGPRQSEHLFNGKSYNAEAHVVHYREDFHSLVDASQYPDGVAIIAIPLSFNEGEENEGFKEFIEKISSIKDFEDYGPVCLMESIRIKFNNMLGLRETRGDQCYATDTGNKFPSYCNLHSRGSKKCGNSVEDVKVYPNIMLPKNPEFYNYTGSFTTPPCSESVYWMVAEHPALIKWEIVDALRTVESRMGNEVIATYGNLRPVQHLAGRRVQRIKYKSF
ncbi:putative carbonic anhydrase 1 isoform X2 [Patella vulgata]|uniref:putative carbonic anhydrase 1 isoform X2 n=1 Tax=Patella vulgata TaxID=6465 RepID=UPI002180894C|nr:putative carbonic anhydrase 1 isoform X2 [Patella vulgata]